MQPAAVAAADLGLKRGREEERVLGQFQGLRASATAAYWKPPQVPRNGVPVSRQCPMAA